MHNWEVDLVTSFFVLLYSIRLRQGGDDKKMLDPLQKAEVWVRSFYHVFVHSCWFHISLEEYFENYIVCLDDGIRENLYFG